MNFRLKLAVTFSLLLMLAVSGLTQSVPSLINYQGKLTDQNGNPLSAGMYGIQFRIWDSATATNGSVDLIWGQQQNATVQTNGVFNIILGSSGGSPISGATPLVNSLAYAFTGSNCFLGVTIVVSNGTTVVAPSEIIPRQQLLSVPFALNSANGNPSGTILAYSGTTAPPGYLMCDGASYPRNLYPTLSSVVQSSFGGDANNFNVPDFQGRFLRGVDGTTGRDPDDAIRSSMAAGGNTGNAIGSVQGFAMQKHKHLDAGHTHGVSPGGALVGTATWVGNGGNQVEAPSNTGSLGINTGYANLGDPVDSGTGAGTPALSNETRPVNAYVNYIIKY